MIHPRSLSNSRYHVSLMPAGGGYSNWGPLAVTRWRQDAALDGDGVLVFLHENSRPSLACRCVCTPLAASTSSVVCCAGAESAWVSLPRQSGPMMPACVRYSAIAWAMARMYASLKLPLMALPRWPLVPKATRWLGSLTSGVFR